MRTIRVVVAGLLAIGLVSCGDNLPDPSPVIDAPTCGTPTTVFLNRAGGTYTPGPDDASTNTSSVLSAAVTVSPTIADADWSFFVTCMTNKFAPFNVVVTDQDPGAVPHTEVAVIDKPEDIGLNVPVGAISPFGCAADGGPKRFDAAIVFLMWVTNGTNGDRCWSAAQVVGSSFGLDHALSCPDLMTFKTGCGATADKMFTDETVECGEFEPRACTCGGTTQNSFQYLQATLGAACQ